VQETGGSDRQEKVKGSFATENCRRTKIKTRQGESIVQHEYGRGRGVGDCIWFLGSRGTKKGGFHLKRGEKKEGKTMTRR